MKPCDFGAMSLMQAVVVILLVCPFAASPAQALTIHVPFDQPTIQAGIDAASEGDTVLVADGTYTGVGNRDIDFIGKNLVLMSENGPEVTIIDCQANPDDPHRGFSIHSGESTSVIEGFRVTNGYASSGGGALYVLSSVATFNNCIFEDNTSEFEGGAVFMSDAALKTNHCEFRSNRSLDATGPGPVIGEGRGGAIYQFNTQPMQHGNILEVSFCVFYDNQVEDGLEYPHDGSPFPAPGSGAAIHSTSVSVYSTTILVHSTTFVNNGTQGLNPSLISVLPTYISIENSIVAFNSKSICAEVISCSNLFGNQGGDWVECAADQANINNNFAADPLFCDTANGDMLISSFSPCTPDNSPCGSLIGALQPGCSVCCVNIRGNVDYDPGDVIDISDLVYLVDYMFTGGPAPVCFDEANIDGLGGLDISDLVFLVDYMFSGGEAPPVCP